MTINEMAKVISFSQHLQELFPNLKPYEIRILAINCIKKARQFNNIRIRQLELTDYKENQIEDILTFFKDHKINVKQDLILWIESDSGSFICNIPI